MGEIGESDIRSYFSSFGPIIEVQMKVDLNRNDPFAFVIFESVEDAAAARNALHRTPGLGSNSLIVDFKRSNAV